MRCQPVTIGPPALRGPGPDGAARAAPNAPGQPPVSASRASPRRPRSGAPTSAPVVAGDISAMLWNGVIQDTVIEQIAGG